MSQSPDMDGLAAGEKLKVLVVDDEPTLRLGFAYALSNRTTTVETAATGRHALEKFAEGGANFDILILDLRMPGLDGVGVIEALRGQGTPIPIVLCSTSLHPNAALRAIRHGVVDFLLKPVRPVDLRQVVDSVLHPGPQPLAQALQAARDGRIEQAIRILENDQAPEKQAACWLDVLKSIRDADVNEDTSPLPETIGTDLSHLAFNAP